MDRIAEEAEYAPGTIYLYFKDKDALYSALFARKLTQMVDLVEAAAKAGAEPLEGLHNAIRAQFEFNERNREFFEVCPRGQKSGKPLVKPSTGIMACSGGSWKKGSGQS